MRCLSCESDLGLAVTRTAAPSADWIRDVPRFPPGKVFDGRFTIVEQVARGGMSVVYKAIDRELGSDVALKILPPELAARPDFVERFRREVRVTRQINHPNVCRVFDIGSAEGLLYFSMEWVKGETVRDLLRRARTLPESRALEIAEKVARALEAAHEHGVIHRDLKPGNVMIDDQGEVRVMDFGVASEPGPGELTSLYFVPGTPEYMAPEQRRGATADARTDLYALGLFLEEMLTGAPPNVHGGRPLRGEVAAIVARLRAEEPARRYPAAGETAQAIAAVRAHGAKKRRWQDLMRSKTARTVATVAIGLATGAAIVVYPPKLPSPAYFFWLRGNDYLRSAETIPVIDNAIQMFYRGTLVDSTYAPAWAGLGEAYWYRYERTKEKTSKTEAERAVDKATRLGADLPETRLARARGLIAVGRNEDARLILVALVKDEPRNDFAWAALGRVYRNLGRYESGLLALQRAIKLEPNHFRHHLELGTFYQKFGEYDEAAREFRRTTELKKDSPTALVNLGASYLKRNRPQEAIPYLEKALRFEQRAATYSNLGTAYYYVHDYEKAAQSYQAAAALDRADPTFPGNAGDAYRMLGREAEADTAYRESVRRARAILAETPDKADVRDLLALSCARMRDAPEALQEANRALVGRADDMDALFTNAVVRAVLHRDDEAVYWLERAVRFGLGRAQILNDPDLARLRGQPRFERVLELAS